MSVRIIIFLPPPEYIFLQADSVWGSVGRSDAVIPFSSSLVQATVPTVYWKARQDLQVNNACGWECHAESGHPQQSSTSSYARLSWYFLLSGRQKLFCFCQCTTAKQSFCRMINDRFFNISDTYSSVWDIVNLIRSIFQSVSSWQWVMNMQIFVPQ